MDRRQLPRSVPCSGTCNERAFVANVYFLLGIEMSRKSDLTVTIFYLRVASFYLMSFYYYLPPRMGDIAMPPHASICLVTFSFRTVTQKRMDVFSQNFAGTCTMSWGCAV